MRALMSTNNNNNNNNNTTSSNKTTTTTKTRHQLQPPQRAQSTIGVPPRQKKNDSFGPSKQHPSSRFGGGARLPPPPSQKREVTTTKQRSTNGRETAPPIAPRLKPREPPVLAKYPPTATAAQGRKRGDQRVLVRGGPARTKTPSSSLLVTSTSTAAGGRKMTRTTTMTTSTVFGRQNGTEKQRQETIGTSELELEKQLKKKIEETNASPGRKRTLCKEAFDDVVQKSNLFRGRLELIRDVIFNDNNNAEDEKDENETKVVKCLVCAENTPTKIRTLEDSLRIEKLERSNAKRENANAMKTIAELRADVTQLGKIISRVFRNEIKPNELKEIAARFREAAASSASSSSEDKNESEEEDDDEEDNQWTPLPKTSQFYGLPVEEISWGRTLTARVMSPGYPVPKLDFSFVTNSVDAEDEDSFCRESASSSVVSDDSFYDDQEEEDDDDDTVVNNNNNAEKEKEDDDDDDDEDAEVDRWLNS
jgi:hypothetical protein